MNSILLTADTVSYRIGGKCLVEAASLQISRGSRLAIIGPNGAGKSTLLRMLAGLAAPTSGAIHIEGENINRLTPLDRARRFALVGQTDTPDRQLRAIDYVALGRIPHGGRYSAGTDREIVGEAMDRAGVASFAARTVGSLSGGERQRLQLARALAQQPAILFLDEPTNHLDPKARSALLSLVSGLGITTVAVLHDLPLVAPFASHVAVMHAGKIVAAGTPNETLTPRIVSQVFDLDVLRLRHPHQDRELMVFDVPGPVQSDKSRRLP
ncbi:iron complex transport system ATP-binding protein [Phyllobacterium sp. YR620]|uniref:ABC transporter ATP-binding protein n=1 Tax=Phyllobacterium sp. YR620 TaxID=1881066 RepID=UPI000887091A|nr:ABC transporter ATP-binding protein [Phyllobacterium sp. YR620]SDP71258.1 iron complex transport system ATP-binding protein [Phyllobacterium sp. YR620]